MLPGASDREDITMCKSFVILLGALCFAAANCLPAQPAFFRNDILVGPGPQAVAAGDFNGDSRPDVVVSTAERLLVLLSAGDGALGSPIPTEAAPAGQIVVADFNGDDRDDLAMDHSALLSLGDGTFQPSQSDLGRVVAAADFNLDGNHDLLAFYSGPGSPESPPPAIPPSVVVWLGHGDGTFQLGPSVMTSVELWGATVADFNRDGLTDAAVWELGTLEIFLGNGDATFGPAVRTDRFAWTPIRTADFNGDGLPDLVTEDRILLGDGDGNFTRSVWYQTLPDGQPFVAPAFSRWPIAVADFTGDGNSDVALALEDRNFILVLPGNGDDTLLPPERQLVGWGNQPVAATTDLDGDGRLDMVTANFLSGSVSVLMSRDPEGSSLQRAVSAASDTAVVAPESLATLMAPVPVTVTLSAFPPWPAGLGGVSLEVTDSLGATHVAPLVFVSPTQINFQVPAGVALGEAALTIVGEDGTTDVGTMHVDAVAPALFMRSHPVSIPAATAVIVEPDGYQIGAPVFLCSPSGAVADCSLSGLPLSAYGDREIYVSFYGTGFRGANTDNVTCSIDGIPVPVVYAGPQATPGVDQINVRLVPELLHGRRRHGEVVTMRINGVAANSAGISVY